MTQERAMHYERPAQEQRAYIASCEARIANLEEQLHKATEELAERDSAEAEDGIMTRERAMDYERLAQEQRAYIASCEARIADLEEQLHKATEELAERDSAEAEDDIETQAFDGTGLDVLRHAVHNFHRSKEAQNDFVNMLEDYEEDSSKDTPGFYLHRARAVCGNNHLGIPDYLRVAAVYRDVAQIGREIPYALGLLLNELKVMLPFPEERPSQIK